MSVNSSTRPRPWTRTQSSYRSTFVASRFARYIASQPRQQVRCRPTVPRSERHTDADVDADREPPDRERLCEVGTECAHQVLDLHAALGAGSQGLEHRELVAGQPRGHSLGGKLSASRRANAASTASPTSCPNSSLTSLNRSRSISITIADVDPPAPPTTISTRSAKARRFARPVKASCRDSYARSKACLVDWKTSTVVSASRGTSARLKSTPTIQIGASDTAHPGRSPTRQHPAPAQSRARPVTGQLRRSPS